MNDDAMDVQVPAIKSEVKSKSYRHKRKIAKNPKVAIHQLNK